MFVDIAPFLSDTAREEPASPHSVSIYSYEGGQFQDTLERKAYSVLEST